MKEQIKYYITANKVINIIFFLCFFIYLKKLQIDVETQPFIIFFLALCLILFNKVYIRKKDVFLILHILVLSIYLVFQIYFKRTGVIPYFTYLVGPVTYLVFLNRFQFVSEKVVKGIILIYAFTTVILLLKIPGLYYLLTEFYELFISRSGWMDGSDIRGITLFAPEPSYFAFASVFFLVALDVLHLNGYKVLKYKLIVIAIAIISKSALVFFYTGIYLLFYYLGNEPLKRIKAIKPKRILIFISFILILIIPFFIFEQSRVVEVFNNIFENISSSENFKNLLLKEVSGSTRFILNSLGFLSIEYAPFGWGIGEFQNNFYIVGSQFHDLMNNHGVLSEPYIKHIPLKAQTYFANLTGDIGVFSFFMLIFLIVSLFGNTHSKIKRGLQWVVPLMLILVQAQISNPIPWVLLAIINSKSLLIEKV